MPLSVCEVHRSAQSNSRKQQSFQGSKQDHEGLIKQLTNSVGIQASFTFSAASDHRQQLHADAALLPDVSRNRTCQLSMAHARCTCQETAPWHFHQAAVPVPTASAYVTSERLMYCSAGTVKHRHYWEFQCRRVCVAYHKCSL